ncbi:MAG: tetraacyldisaccharide 4'-kinase [Candidatus Omnitrophota bacterium]
MLKDYLYSLATDKEKGFIAAVFKILLFMLSLIYGLAVRILLFIYRIRPCRLSPKVISVGNITLGGTGKTLLVEMLSRYLKDKGHKVSVLSRGYKKPAVCSLSLAPGYQTMGDEPYMLSRNLGNIPVVVDKDRIRGAMKAVRDYGSDTVILDDGFQQWKIRKNLDIVAIDARNPLGNLNLIPRGILREPLSSLRRADIFVLTKINLNPDNQNIKRLLNQINPGALIVEAAYQPEGFYKFGQSRDNLLSPGEFIGEKVSLVCGIADPQSFENMVSNLGVDIGACFRFPDHHRYSEADLKNIIKDSKAANISKVITTEKDSVRLPASGCGLPGIQWHVLRIKLEVAQYETFVNRINSLY